MSDKTSDTAVSSFYIGTPRSFNVGIIVMTTMLEYRNPASRHPRPTSEQPRRRLHRLRRRLVAAADASGPLFSPSSFLAPLLSTRHSPWNLLDPSNTRSLPSSLRSPRFLSPSTPHLTPRYVGFRLSLCRFLASSLPRSLSLFSFMHASSLPIFLNASLPFSLVIDP